MSKGSRKKRSFFSGPVTKSEGASKNTFFEALKKNLKNIVATKLEGGGGVRP